MPQSKPILPLYINRWSTGLYTNRSALFPPAGNLIDALIDGLNVEVTNQLTLARRPGFSKFSTVQLDVSETPLDIAHFHPQSGSPVLVLDTNTRIAQLTSSAITTIRTKTNSARASFIGVGDFLYIGHADAMEKWNGTTRSKWGIVKPSFTPDIKKYTAADSATIAAVGGGTPGAVRSANVVTITTASAHGFVVGKSVTIAGVTDASFNGSFTIASVPTSNSFTYSQTGPDASSGNGTATSGGPNIVDVNGQIVFDGLGAATVTTLSPHGFSAGNQVTITGNSNDNINRTYVILSVTTDTFIILDPENALQEGIGGSATSDTTVTRNILPPAASQSGAVRSANVVTITTTAPHGFLPNLNVNISGVTDASFNGIFRIKSVPTDTSFTYDQTGPDATSGGGTAAPAILNKVSFTSGRKYGYAFKNSSTTHLSTGSPLSVSTGALTDGNVIISGKGSSDPQVDFIEVYGTADGGSTLFVIGMIANPGANNTWYFLDDTPDIKLGTRTLPQSGLNDPPPNGMLNLVFFAGHLWGSVGNKVFYNGGPAILNGVPEEAWPPLNFFVFPDEVQRLVPTQFGLLVWTNREVFVILLRDDGTFQAIPWQSGLGISNYYALDVDGDNIYAFTSQKQMIHIGPGGITEIGFPIGPQLSAFDPAQARVVVWRDGTEESAVYVSNATTDIYKLSLVLSAWMPVYRPVPGAKMISNGGSVKDAHHEFFLANTGGFVLKRDASVFTDDGAQYSAFFTVGSLVVAPPGQLEELYGIVLEKADINSIGTVSLRLNEFGPKGGADPNATGFLTLDESVPDPPLLSNLTTYQSKRFYTHKLTSAPLVRHLQVRVVLPTSSIRDEYLSLGVLLLARPTE